MDQNSGLEFQRARTREQVEARRGEILDACQALFQECDYDDITLKAIAERTSISRTSLYSYYQTRDEVFLGLLEREYLGWHKELEKGLVRETPLDADELCAFLADSMLERTTMRRLLSVNLTDIENKSSLAQLCSFKRNAVRPVKDTIRQLTARTFPNADEADRERFHNLFLLLVFNLYPYAHLTPKQAEACKIAGIEEPAVDERDLCFASIRALAQTMQ